MLLVTELFTNDGAQTYKAAISGDSLPSPCVMFKSSGIASPSQTELIT